MRLGEDEEELGQPVWDWTLPTISEVLWGLLALGTCGLAVWQVLEYAPEIEAAVRAWRMGL